MQVLRSILPAALVCMWAIGEGGVEGKQGRLVEDFQDTVELGMRMRIGVAR